MARIRSVHPDLLLSTTMADIGADPNHRARLERTFTRLWLVCDDAGVVIDNPRKLAQGIYPMHDEVTASTIDEEMWWLEEAGLIQRYTTDEGVDYLCVRSWHQYQHPQHPAKNVLPRYSSTNAVIRHRPTFEGDPEDDGSAQ